MTLPIVISLAGVAISLISVSAMIYFNRKNGKHTDDEDLKEQIREKMNDLKERERERAKDIEERTRENTIINTKLDNINFSNQEIKDRLNSAIKQIQDHGDRLIKVEESVKSAHHRLNTLEELVEKKEDKK